MKFKDTGFRALYRQFTVFPLSGESREDMAAYPQIEGAEIEGGKFGVTINVDTNLKDEDVNIVLPNTVFE